MELNGKNKNLDNRPVNNAKKNNLPEYLLYPDNGDLHYYYKFNKKNIQDSADMFNIEFHIETERARALNMKASNHGMKSNISHLPGSRPNTMADTEEIEGDYDNYSSIGDLVRTTRNRVKENIIV